MVHLLKMVIFHGYEPSTPWDPTAKPRWRSPSHPAESGHWWWTQWLQGASLCTPRWGPHQAEVFWVVDRGEPGSLDRLFHSRFHEISKGRTCLISAQWNGGLLEATYWYRSAWRFQSWPLKPQGVHCGPWDSRSVSRIGAWKIEQE